MEDGLVFFVLRLEARVMAGRICGVERVVVVRQEKMEGDEEACSV